MCVIGNILKFHWHRFLSELSFLIIVIMLVKFDTNRDSLKEVVCFRDFS